MRVPSKRKAVKSGSPAAASATKTAEVGGGRTAPSSDSALAVP